MRILGRAVVLFSAILFVLVPAAVSAHRGVNMSSDGMIAFVSKDVGGERWAMILHMDSLLAIGNVYRPDGGDPAFLWCPMRSMHGDMGRFDQAEITFSCFGTHECVDTCPEWDFIDDVTLPGNFFVPSDR